MSTEPAILLTAQLAQNWLTSAWPGQILAEVTAIATGRVACYDTATHVAVQKMTEEQAREKFFNSSSDVDFQWRGYLAALRDAGVIKP